MFPTAPVLPDGNVVIPHGLPETLMLRHLGYKIPHPMPLYYDFPAPAHEPAYAVQKTTCVMMTENPKFYNLNHMGTGKTRCALWSWDYLNKAGLAKKLLVVAPLSTLRFNWQAEVFRIMPWRKVKVLHGTKKERLELLAEDADIYIINHHGVNVIEEPLKCRADIDTLVIDELAVYRNNSDRSKVMREFVKKFDKVWGMTGSPMPNEPTDVWAQCMIVTPTRVPKYRTHARHMLMTHITNYLWKPKPDAVAKAFSWMQPSCRFALEDVTELPPLIKRTVDVPLSAHQERIYKRVAHAFHVEIKEKIITALNAGAAMNKLLQIAGGWVYTQNPEFVRIDPTPRILAMADIVKSAERKVIIAVPYRHMLKGISDILNMKGVEVDHCVVHGDTPNKEVLFNAFQNTDRYRVMMAHPQCVHHGLTLTAADTILWYLPITSLDIYNQFNARITRIGQKHKQQIFHLQATPVERKIYKMLQDHQKMQNLFLQLVEEATTGEAIP